MTPFVAEYIGTAIMISSIRLYPDRVQPPEPFFRSFDSMCCRSHHDLQGPCQL